MHSFYCKINIRQKFTLDIIIFIKSDLFFCKLYNHIFIFNQISLIFTYDWKIKYLNSKIFINKYNFM